MEHRHDSQRLPYFDGLRGWAALSVVIFHTGCIFSGQFSWVAWSSLGLLNDGPLAVAIFFVLSGVVLSHGFLCTQDHRVLVRLTAGRYPRLMIPVAAASLIALLMMLHGWMHNRLAAGAIGSPWLGDLVRLQPSWWLWLCYALLGAFMRDFGMHGYGPFLWTMPIEFMGSMLMFLLLGITGWSRTARIAAGAFVAVLLSWLYPVVVVFIVGLLVSEILVLPRVREFRGAGLPLFVAGWIGSMALRDGRALPVGWLFAALVVLGVSLSPLLQRMMQLRFSAWLGRISFPLYLMHGLVICGPMSWAVLHLHAYGWPAGEIATAAIPSTVAVSLAAAQLFLPVERAAVQVSRWLGLAAVSGLPAPRQASLVQH